MKICSSIIIVICSLAWIVSCGPCRRISETVQSFNRTTGEAVAVDSLIQKYEKQHQKFYLGEIRNGAHLEWLALDSKNLSMYCKKYLQHSVPSITTDITTGKQIRIELHYEKKNTRITSLIPTVHCKVVKKHALSYYITRAPEPNCVYSLKCTPKKKEYAFKIIHKYCDFEDKPLINKALKRKRVEITAKVHHNTGQPIAKDEYLLKYELEHQEMLKKEGKDGKYMEWPYAMAHPNLDSYCYQYMGKCVRRRYRDGVTGSWSVQKFHYQKLNVNQNVRVTTVTCSSPNASKSQYNMTRAPEPNCAYALIRKGYNGHAPLVIVFKHCDFKDQTYQPNFSHDHSISDKNSIPKVELKEEILDTSEMLQLFSVE